MILIALMTSLTLNAQDGVRHSISGDFRLPTPTGNRALASTTDGIAEVSLSYQYPFFKGFGLGIGAGYMLMKVNEFALNIPNTLVKGKMHRYAPYAKIFYQKATNDKFIVEAACKIGGAIVDYESVFCTQLDVQSRDFGIFIEPSIGAHMFAQDNFSIGLIFSYGINGVEFTPESICLENFPGFDQDDYVGVTQNFSIGFAFSAFLRQGRRR